MKNGPARQSTGLKKQTPKINPFWYGKDRDTASQIVKVQNEKLAELCAARNAPKLFGMKLA